MTRPKNKSIRYYFISIIIGIGVLSFLYGTKNGIGVTPDTMSYFKMADTILLLFKKGIHIYPYFFHFPPLYPLLLSISHIFKTDTVAFAKLIGLLVLVLNTVFMYILLEIKSTEFWAFIFSLIFIFVLLPIHTLALTDPLFFTLLIIFLFLVELYKEHKNNIYFGLILFILALSPLLRYAGVTLMLSYILYLIINKEKSKIKIISTILTQLPLALYFLYSKGLGTRALSIKLSGIKGFFAHFLVIPFNLFFPFAYMEVLSHKLPLNTFLYELFIIVIVGFSIYLPLIYYCKSAYSEYKRKLTFIFVATYTGFILFSRLFLDAYLPADVRIFSPIFIAILPEVAACFKTSKPKLYLPIFYIVLLFVTTLLYLGNIHTYGIGYTSKKWANSETIQLISKSHKKCRIYSNFPEVIHLYTGAESHILPKYIIPENASLNPNFYMEIEKLKHDLKNKKCPIIVYFKGSHLRWYIIPRKKLTAIFPPKDSITLHDGVIYIY